jgi:PAS domain S-box-containing protein
MSAQCGRSRGRAKEGEVEILIVSKQFDATIETGLRRRITGGLVIAILLTILIGSLSWRNAQAAADDADRVTHSYAVIGALERTAKDLIEVEASARSSAVTGEDSWLTPYETAKSAVAQDEATLRYLTADNPTQQHRLDVLDPQIRAALGFAESKVGERRQRLASSGAGETLETNGLMDAVRATSQDMRAEEMRLLRRRTQETGTRRRVMNFIILAGTFIGAGLLALSGFAVNREIDISARARARIDALNAESEDRLKQWTTALQLEIAISQAAHHELDDQKFALDQHAIVAVTDVQGTITYVNDKFCAISQYSKDDLIGQNHRILNSGHHTREFFQQMYHAIANGQVWQGEIKNRAKDGSSYWVDTTIVPFIGEQGKPRQYVAIRTDITERKLTEEALAASRQALETQSLMLQSVLDSIADGLVAADEQGRLTLWNPAAARIIGLGAAEGSSQEWAEHYGLYLNDTVTPFPPEQLPLVLAIQGETSTAEMFVRNPALEQGVWIEASASPLKNKEGALRGGVVAFRDVTQRKVDEREIRKLNDELEVRVAERTALLEIANKELEAFSYSVSHDLRAPLRHISGFTKLLKEKLGSSLDASAQDFLGRIQAGTQEMGVLVDELLKLARVGRHVLKRRSTNLNSIVEEVIAILQPDSDGREVEWVIAELPDVECDAILIKQVFQNLMANALKFTRPRVGAARSEAAARAPDAHTVIEIGYQEEDGQPIFMVRDNGVGFSMKYVDKLFGVFQRLHTSEEFEGTGIGLVTVKRIVHRHGGRVWAEGVPDKGAAFYFTMGAGEQAGLKSSAAMAGGQL